MKKVVFTICGETVALMSDENQEMLVEAAQKLEDHIRALGASATGEQRKKLFICAALAFSLETLKYEKHYQLLNESLSSVDLSNETAS